MTRRKQCQFWNAAHSSKAKDHPILPGIYTVQIFPQWPTNQQVHSSTLTSADGLVRLLGKKLCTWDNQGKGLTLPHQTLEYLHSDHFFAPRIFCIKGKNLYFFTANQIENLNKVPPFEAPTDSNKPKKYPSIYQITANKKQCRLCPPKPTNVN